ncbi:thioredoxin family protein [Terrabacter terrigena]|uniref:Thioredoxin family protein n=1 Tax=Terrabacter terrigena TaxID=574718 RepID=A0ABW3MWI8_9MICO
MDVQLLYFDGCPNWLVAEERLRDALAVAGRGDARISRVLVETPQEAEQLGFIGSPTILLDGRDPFATGTERPALACRVFTTPEGRAGSPTVEQLVEALS